jgi:uncharacterized protein (DUF1015 family)
MAIIKPFPALRPSKDNAHLVASVPYDVVDRSEAKKLAEGNPLSFLRVTRSEIELDENINPYSPDVYKKAKENLERLIQSAPLTVDTKPRFYLYKLEMDGRSQVGIAATFSVDDYDKDIIKKHEKTRKVKEDDRTNHIVTTNAQTGQVFLTYKGSKRIDEIVNNTLTNTKSLYNFTSDDGIKHSIWIVPEDFNKIIIEEIAQIKNLYIADGHHRAASASRARKVKMNSNPFHNGNEEYNFFIAVLFPAEQLKILPYNRIVLDLNGKTKEDFLGEISEKFTIEKTNTREPFERKNFCMYFEKEWYLLKARDSISASNTLSSSIADTLDVSKSSSWHRRSPHK